MSIIATIIIIIVKGSENITVIENDKKTIINMEGIVMMRIEPGKPGVVKVNNETWSAKSEQVIEKGEKIIVKNIEGLYLIAEKKSDK